MKKSFLTFACGLIFMFATFFSLSACGEKQVTDATVDITDAKTTYSYGESFDPTGLAVDLTYDDDSTGAIAYANFTENKITIDSSAFVSTTAGTYAIIVIYDNSTTIRDSYDVTVANPTENGFTIDSSSVKTIYEVGEDLDLSNLKVYQLFEESTATLENREIALSVAENDGGYTVDSSTYNKNLGGVYAVTVSYGLYTDQSFNVTVEKEVQSLSVTNPTKTSYAYNDTLDLTGLIVQRVYNDGTSDTITQGTGNDNYNVSGFSSTTIGTQTITIEFNGDASFKQTFDITLSEPEMVDIQLNSSAVITKYKVGSSVTTVDLTDLKVYKVFSVYNAPIILMSEKAKNTEGAYLTSTDAGYTDGYEVSINTRSYVEDKEVLTPATFSSASLGTYVYKFTYTYIDDEEETQTIIKTFDVEIVTGANRIAEDMTNTTFAKTYAWGTTDDELRENVADIAISAFNDTSLEITTTITDGVSTFVYNSATYTLNLAGSEVLDSTPAEVATITNNTFVLGEQTFYIDSINNVVILVGSDTTTGYRIPYRQDATNDESFSVDIGLFLGSVAGTYNIIVTYNNSPNPSNPISYIIQVTVAEPQPEYINVIHSTIPETVKRGSTGLTWTWSNLAVTLYYEDNETETLTSGDSGYSIDYGGYDINIVGVYTITISYNGVESYSFEIEVVRGDSDSLWYDVDDSNRIIFVGTTYNLASPAYSNVYVYAGNDATGELLQYLPEGGILMELAVGNYYFTYDYTTIAGTTAYTKHYTVVNYVKSFDYGTDYSLNQSTIDSLGTESSSYISGTSDYVYQVGTGNAYYFDIKIRELGITNASATNDVVEYEFLKWNGAEYAEISEGLVTVENGYKFVFDSSLIGKTIKCKASLKYQNREDGAPLKTLTFIFVLNNGYNVFNDADMEIAFGNLDVQTINLQRNIVVSLNSNQYNADGSIRNIWAGSELSSGYLDFDINGNITANRSGNAYVRAGYNINDDNLVINGNYFNIDASGLDLLTLTGSYADQPDTFLNPNGTNEGKAINAQSAIFAINTEAGSNDATKDDSFKETTYNIERMKTFVYGDVTYTLDLESGYVLDDENTQVAQIDNYHFGLSNRDFYINLTSNLVQDTVSGGASYAITTNKIIRFVFDDVTYTLNLESGCVLDGATSVATIDNYHFVLSNRDFYINLTSNIVRSSMTKEALDISIANKVTFNNLTIIGNTKTPTGDATNDEQIAVAIANSGGYTGIRAQYSDIVTNNVNVYFTLIGLYATSIPTDIYATDTQVSESWANNLYVWSGGLTKLVNSKFGNAGGGSIWIDDHSTAIGIFNPSFEMDDLTTVENWVSGTEAWFVVHNMSLLATGVKASLDAGIQESLGKTIITTKTNATTGQEFELFNFSVILASFADDIEMSDAYGEDWATITNRASFTIDGIEVNQQVKKLVILSQCQ